MHCLFFENLLNFNLIWCIMNLSKSVLYITITKREVKNNERNNVGTCQGQGGKGTYI
jgi:hypothetical protein